MSHKGSKTYSSHSRKAVSLLGEMIKLHRKDRKMSAKDLADRAGISRTTLHKVEGGDMKCEIGIVFELAALVDVRLFDSDSVPIGYLQEKIKDKIALLPKSIRAPKEPVDDEF